MHYRIFLFLLLAPALGWGAPTPLFSSDAPLKAVLTAPISQAYQQKRQEQRLYLEGHWSYLEGDTTVLGRPYFVMEFIEGAIPADVPRYTQSGFLVEEATPAACGSPRTRG